MCLRVLVEGSIRIEKSLEATPEASALGLLSLKRLIHSHLHFYAPFTCPATVCLVCFPGPSTSCALKTHPLSTVTSPLHSYPEHIPSLQLVSLSNKTSITSFQAPIDTNSKLESPSTRTNNISGLSFPSWRPIDPNLPFPGSLRVQSIIPCPLFDFSCYFPSTFLTLF